MALNVIEEHQYNIVKSSIGEILPQRFLNYAMSVIQDRALPDVRDGLKPVHRRILYSMYELGLKFNGPYKKSARTVGDVLGKYHPHGDQSVYEAMVILAQAFSTRYPLVDGHGNFGSIDGDPAAAMRYTESRLSKYGQALLADITKNIVDYKPNYDQEELEPTVLGNLLPNLLLNGTFGIAVGMSTKIPSHNIHDIYAACYKIIEDSLEGKDTDIEDLIKLIKAPDFATGGKIIGLSGVKTGYRTGKGKVCVRGVHEIVEDKKGTSIIITELPYNVNKEKFINNVRDLMKDEKDKKGKITKKAIFSQIREINDESDKEGIRIVIDIKKNESAQLVVNNLIKNTKFQDNFNMQLIALVDGQPLLLNIQEMLEHFLAHATSVLIRRTEFDLIKANKRMNIVSGMLKCLEDEEVLQRVIDIIRHAENPIETLCTEIELNKDQAEFISEMKIRALSNANHQKLREEHADLEATINDFNAILNDESVLLLTLKKEFQELEEKFGDERRTEIQLEVGSIEEEDLIKEETLIITYTNDGIIKAVEEKEYKSQRRGGVGTKATNTKEDEVIKFMFTTSSKDDLLFFTNEGRCHTLKAFKIGKSSKAAKGRSINNYLQLNPGEKIVNVLNTNIKNKENDLLFVTKLGKVKRLSLNQLSTRLSTTKVITFNEGDNLIQALLLEKGNNVLIVTAKGKGIRINPDSEKNEIRAMGRSAAGVKGITLKGDDEVVDMCLIDDDNLILTITENGLAKRSRANEYNIINRGGQGITTHKINEKTGKIIAAISIKEQDNSEIFIASEQGLIVRIPTGGISIVGRSSMGVKAINLKDNDKAVSASINFASMEEEEDGEE